MQFSRVGHYKVRPLAVIAITACTLSLVSPAASQTIPGADVANVRAGGGQVPNGRAAPDVTDTTPPSAPSGLTTTLVGGAVLLDWYSATDDTNIAAYHIYRDNVLLAAVNSATLSYLDTKTQGNTTYHYMVKAVDEAANTSPPSSAVRVTTPTGSTGADAVMPSREPATAADDVPAVPAAFAPQLRRYPYLTDVVGRYATINWATDQSATIGSVTWGRIGVESCGAHSITATRTPMTVNNVRLYQWKALLTLTPGTRYCYRVKLGSVDLLGTDAAPRFWTQVPAGSTEPFSFAVFGDWGAVDASGANSHQANVLRRVAASGVRFAVTTGDNANPAGSQDNYGDLVQQGPNLSGVFGPNFWKVPGASIPIFPSLGNHGFSRADTYHPHLVNWPQDRAVASSSGRYFKETYCCLNGTISGKYPSAWYAFDAGNARFYVLEAAWTDLNVGTASDYKNDQDYHWTPSSAEYQWLEQDLATHPSALKFAFFHYPLYSDNSTEASDTFLHGSDSLEGLLSRYGVDIGFSGHAQLYQRNHKPSPDSLITYVTGGGGDKVKPIGARGCHPLDAYGIGWSFSANGGQGAGSACGRAPVPTSPTQVYHFLHVRVAGTRVTVTPIDELGRAFDVVTYDFGVVDARPPDAPAALRGIASAANRVNLSWTAATDNVAVTGYRIYRNGTLLTTTGPVSRFTDTRAAPSSSYRYIVRALDAEGNLSTPSNVVAVTTPTRSVVFSDPFELGDLSMWTSSSGLLVQTTVVRSGRYAAQGSTTNGRTYAKRTLPSLYTDAYARLHFNVRSLSTQTSLLRFRTANDASVVGLFLTSAGRLGLRNDVSAATFVSAGSIASGWHALELRAKINGSAGSTEVWLDGTRIDSLSRTTNMGMDPISRLQIGDVASGGTYNVVLDDVIFATQRVGP
jgi:chitodextrinase